MIRGVRSPAGYVATSADRDHVLSLVERAKSLAISAEYAARRVALTGVAERAGFAIDCLADAADVIRKRPT